MLVSTNSTPMSARATWLWLLVVPFRLLAQQPDDDPEPSPAHAPLWQGTYATAYLGLGRLPLTNTAGVFEVVYTDESGFNEPLSAQRTLKNRGSDLAVVVGGSYGRIGGSHWGLEVALGTSNPFQIGFAPQYGYNFTWGRAVVRPTLGLGFYWAILGFGRVPNSPFGLVVNGTELLTDELRLSAVQFRMLLTPGLEVVRPLSARLALGLAAHYRVGLAENAARLRLSETEVEYPATEVERLSEPNVLLVRGGTQVTGPDLPFGTLGLAASLRLHIRVDY